MIILKINLDETTESIMLDQHSDEALSVIVLPGEKVTVTEIALPKVTAKERLRLAPFILEEHIACDPEEIHIALMKQADDEKYAAAIINRDTFEKQIEIWKAKGAHPQIVLPDFLALIWEPNTWTVVLQDQRAMVRTGLHTGFSIENEHLIFFLHQLLLKQGVHKPEKINVWQQDQALSFDTLNISADYREIDTQKIWDIKGIPSQLNFLYGKYRPKIKINRFKKRWLTSITMAGCFFGFMLLSQCVQWFYLRHEATALHVQVTQLYQQLFPGENISEVSTARADALLQRYQKAFEGGLFLRLLRLAGLALQQYPAIHLQSIQFQHDTLLLRVEAPNADVLSHWQIALREQGVLIKQAILHKTETGNVQAMIFIHSGETHAP